MVLIVIPNTSLGGAEQVLKMIAKQSIKKDVSIFFLSQKKESLWDSIANEKIKLYYSSSTSRLFNVIDLVRFIYTNKKIRWDRVYSSHVNVTGILGILIRLKILQKKHFIARESTTIFERYSGLKLLVYKAMYKLGYPLVDLLICQTGDMYQKLNRALPWLDKKVKIKVIPNPIELDSIYVDEKIDITRYGSYLVSAGRLIPEKGFDLLIQSFCELKKEYPNLKLIILGEGQERKKLEKLIRENDLLQDVFLLGHVNNVYSYFKGARVCVVSSRIEGFPNVLLQMISQNNNVVSTLCAGGIKDIKGIKKALPNNVESLTNTIKEVLKNSSTDNRQKFIEELKKRSIKSFMNQIENNLN